MRSRGRPPLTAALGLLLCLHGRANAQSLGSNDNAPPDTSTWQVRGRIVRPDDTSMVAVAGAWVTLHRVGSDSAGPLDSLRTDAKGEYQFRYHRRGAPSAVYFVSASYDGIAYFSSPLMTPRVDGGDGEIAVFDTTSLAPHFRVRGRHFVVSAPSESGDRTIVEVYEISNDTSVTFVVSGEKPLWITPLPPGATKFSIGQSDVAAQAVTFQDGSVRLFAPFSPGVKQISLSYSLPGTSFPIRVHLAGPADVFEVLVEEPAASVSGTGVKDVGPVSVQGRTFHRFLGENVAGGDVRVDVPTAVRAGWPTAQRIIVAAIGLVMITALFLALRGRGAVTASPRAPRRPVAGVSPGERLARDIADLDESMERRAVVSDAERRAYDERRAELTESLAREIGALAPDAASR